MPVNRLKANICGTTYTLVSEESLSYMRDLVAQVDGEMAEIVQNDRRMSTTMAAVLTALTNADKAQKEARAAEELRLELKRVVDDREHLKDQLAAAREETARLSQEVVQLRTGRQAAPTKTTRKSRTAPVQMTAFEEILDEDDL
ncbi:MAG: cell division protein ZapA [Clostridia bacterium]|nr:cell division protein ZapA [Clostridia bacterium]